MNGTGEDLPPVGQGDLHWETERLRRHVDASRSGAQVLGAPGWAEAPCNGVLLMKTVAPPGVSGVGRAPGALGSSCTSRSLGHTLQVPTRALILLPLGELPPRGRVSRPPGCGQGDPGTG